MLATLRREILGLYMNKAVSIIITILIILFLGLLLVSNIVKSAWVQLQFYVVEDDSYDTDIDENVYTLKLWSVIKTLWNGASYYLAINVFCITISLDANAFDTTCKNDQYFSSSMFSIIVFVDTLRV